MIDITIRAAKPQDADVIHRFICQLADYEQAADKVTLTSTQLRKELEKIEPGFSCFLAELNGESVGFALFFYTFSTWVGKGIHLEDLYVREELRRHGIGLQLFKAIRDHAQEQGYKRLDFETLDWNEAAHKFNQRLGAQHRTDWHSWRIEL